MSLSSGGRTPRFFAGDPSTVKIPRGTEPIALLEPARISRCSWDCTTNRASVDRNSVLNETANAIESLHCVQEERVTGPLRNHLVEARVDREKLRSRQTAPCRRSELRMPPVAAHCHQ